MKHLKALAKTLLSGIIRLFIRSTGLCAIGPEPGRSGRQIYFQNKGTLELQCYGIEEYESLTGLRYTPVLMAENQKTLRMVEERCRKLERFGTLSKEILWNGAYYRPFLESGRMAPVYIAWADNEKEWGLFARLPIAAGEFIGEYAGVVKLIGPFFHGMNPYCFHYPLPLSEWLWFTIDPREVGNETRFMNHSDKANCEAVVAYTGGFLRIVIRARYPIAIGEELTFHYGPTLWGGARTFEACWAVH